MMPFCEACEAAPATVVEPCDDAREPYHLCADCHRRLLARALRPLEWYNLAKRHGFGQFLLHDDFYDEDGTATQPEFDVDSPDRFPSPELRDVRNDPETLLDFTITRWGFKGDVKSAWKELPAPIVLATLNSRFSATQNREIRSAVLQVAAETVAELGSDFVRSVWCVFPADVDLWSLARASAACLPQQEAFDRVAQALSTLGESQKRNEMLCLSSFHSEATLDWMEQNIFSPVTESWGNLAAASKFGWPRAEKWLLTGRPLSLAALDALAAIIRPMTPFLRELAPRLIAPADSQTFRAALAAHVERDPSPRVKKVTEFLLANADSITVGP